MIQRINERTNSGYEVQWYDKAGNNADVTRCDTVEELAQVLSRALWGTMRFDNNPTIYRDGAKYCHCEYTE